MRKTRILMFSVPALCLALLFSATVFAGDKEIPVQIKAIGHPIWRPVDFHVVSAPVGQPPDFADFNKTMEMMLYPLRHQDCGGLGRGPGDPHQPPYLHEFEGNLEIVNLADAQVFKTSAFTTPLGVWGVWMNVPDPGAIGSSPDFTSDRIIPNSLFPIHVFGQTFRNNELWNNYFADFEIPPLDANLPPPICLKGPVDGHSHFPVFVADSSYFGPGGPLQGRYEFRIKMMDASGNGWDIRFSFTVQ